MSYVYNPSGGSGGGTVLPTPSNAGYTKEIWISVRTDGLAGTGTPVDPFDGSTQAKFDALLNALVSGTHVHLYAGVYLTQGNATVGNLPATFRIEGSGQSLTTIRLAPTSNFTTNPSATVLNANNSIANSNQEVDHLTIDGNFGAFTLGSSNVINAIVLYGNNAKIHDLDCIGCWANQQTVEGFFVKIANDIGGSAPQNPNIWNINGYNNFTNAYAGLVLIFGTAVGGVPGMSNGSIHDIYCNGMVGALASSGNSNIGQAVVGFNVSGLDIYNIHSDNCARLIYSEGPYSNIHIWSCSGWNMLNGGIWFVPPGNSNTVTNCSIEDCQFEMNTTGTGAAQKIVFNLGGGATNVTGITLKNCYVYRKSTGVATSTRARTSNVVTVVTLVAHNLASGQAIDVAGFSDATFNGNEITVTVVNGTTFTYNNTGSNVATTADTAGTVGQTVYAFSIPNITNSSVTDNHIDSLCPSLFSTTNPSTISFQRNYTFAGAYLTLSSLVTSAVPSVLDFAVTNSATTNANNLLATYKAAKQVVPNNVATSATNRVTVLVPIGRYDLGSQTFTLDTNFIDVVGMGQREDTFLTSSATCVLKAQTATGDFRLKNLSLNTSSSSATIYALDSSSNFNGAEVLEDLVLNGAGTFNSVRNTNTTNFWNGTYRRILFKNGGFFGDGASQFSGLAEYIEIGANGTSNWFNTGTLRNFVCLGQLNMFRNDGLLEYGKVITTVTNTDALVETNNSGALGVTRFCTFIANGTGKSYNNSGGARSTSIYLCSLNAAFGANITNLIATPNNVTDATHITQ